MNNTLIHKMLNDTKVGYCYIVDDKNAVKFSELKDRIITHIERGTHYNQCADQDYLTFYCDNGDIYIMLHERDCCEDVHIAEIIGDLEDLIGTPILKSSENSKHVSADYSVKTYQEATSIYEGILKYDAFKELIKDTLDEDDYEDSQTWTFYNISTIKGSVTIRWYGTSSGYYSEGVNLYKINLESLTTHLA